MATKAEKAELAKLRKQLEELKGGAAPAKRAGGGDRTEEDAAQEKIKAHSEAMGGGELAEHIVSCGRSESERVTMKDLVAFKNAGVL